MCAHVHTFTLHVKGHLLIISSTCTEAAVLPRAYQFLRTLLILLRPSFQFPFTILISCSVPFHPYTQSSPTQAHFNLNTAKGYTSEMLVPIYQTIQCQNPEKSSPPWKIQILHIMSQYYKLVFLNMSLLKDVNFSLIIKNVSNNLTIIKSVAFKKNN